MQRRGWLVGRSPEGNQSDGAPGIYQRLTRYPEDSSFFTEKIKECKVKECQVTSKPAKKWNARTAENTRFANITVTRHLE